MAFCLQHATAWVKSRYRIRYAEVYIAIKFLKKEREKKVAEHNEYIVNVLI